MDLLKLIAACILLFGGASSHGQILKAEQEDISQALYMGNLLEGDLKFLDVTKISGPRLPINDVNLEGPLEGLDYILQLHERASSSLADQIKRGSREVFGDEALSTSTSARTEVEFPPEVPQKAREPIRGLIVALLDTNALIRAASSELTPEERRILIEGLPQWVTSTPNLKFDFVQKEREPAAKLMALLQKVDLKLIRQAATSLALAVESRLSALRAVAAECKFGLIRFKVEGMMIELGGTGSDLHSSRDAALAIDFGGDDDYTGRFGAGIGYGAVMIDLGGRDRADVPDANFGCGILGVGLAYHLGGRDDYRTRSLSLGAGIAGVGGFFDDGGADRYESVSLSQGFGGAGIGIMIDANGDDTYRLSCFGQGASRLVGFGWLIDQTGNDTYRSTGFGLSTAVGPRKSDSQGASSGIDGYSNGGLALLTDGEGDDVYQAESRAQGFAEFTGYASLQDSDGNDSYTATQFAQAVALENSGASLLDLSGNDAYIGRQNVFHSRGHRNSFSFFLDRDGDDVYAAMESRPALATEASVAMFLDREGNDRYLGPLGQVLVRSGGTSIALFLDSGGSDRVAEGPGPASATISQETGIAYLVDRREPAEPGEAERAAKPSSVPEDKLLLKLLQDASEGNALSTTKLRQMQGPGLLALLKARLSGANEAELKLFGKLALSFPEEASLAIAPYLLSANLREQDKALLVANMFRAESVSAVLPKLLANESMSRATSEAAVYAATTEVIPQLLPMAATQDKVVIVNLMRAFSRLASPITIGTIKVYIANSDLQIRTAAIDALLKFPAEADQSARSLIATNAEREIRIGIKILGGLGSPAGLDLVGSFLNGATAGIKISAMNALNGRCPERHRETLALLRNDSNPMVRAVARNIDPGR